MTIPWSSNGADNNFLSMSFHHKLHEFYFTAICFYQV